MKFRSVPLFLLAVGLGNFSALAQGSINSLKAQEGKVFANLRNQKIVADINGEKLAGLLNLGSDVTFSLIRATTDRLGVQHLNFAQYYKGVKVTDGMIMVHAKDGYITSINGNVVSIEFMNTNAGLDEMAALEFAERALELRSTLRNYASELQIIQNAQNEPVLAYGIRIDGFDKEGKLLMKRVYIDANNGEHVKSKQLIAHTDVTGNAHTYFSGTRTIQTDFNGTSTYRLFDSARNIHTLDATGAEQSNWGVPFFDNAKEFINDGTEWTAKKAITSTRLATATNGIMTNIGISVANFPVAMIGTPSGADIVDPSWPNVFYNTNSLPLRAFNWFSFVNPGTNYIGAFAKVSLISGLVTDSILFTIDASSTGTFPWTDNNGNSGNYTIDSVKNPALDAHWGISRTYDYYVEKFARESYDGAGGKIINYMNGVFPLAGTQNNAAALPPPYNAMVYGLGDGTNTNPFSALDVTAHEFTHMVTEHNGNGGLDYEGESGALNEAFSDIFGVSLDFYAHGSAANWIIGEEVIAGNGYLRSMSNPKARQNPDTYMGQFWVNTSSEEDNGGVHTNSGVANHWYYLLVEGGTGTNDKSYAYNVTGIGLAKAEQIAYRTLTQYLTPVATFQDAFEGSLMATIDLYGTDTTAAEYVAVKNAWYAVGLGEGANGTSINNISLTNPNIQVFPNPVSGAQFNINSTLDKSIEATIFNNLGQKVKIVKINKGNNTIDISGLAKGMYNISFSVENRNYVHKVSLY